MRVSFIALLFCLATFSSLATNQFYPCSPFSIDTTAPKIFLLGENPELEDYLSRVYPEGIVDVYEGNAQLAFSNWANMLKEMDTYAETQKYDIKGLKAFATFYWGKNGEIEHIAYSLKAHSLYIKHKDLEPFFLSFMKHYTLPVKAKTRFQHTFTLALPYPTIIKGPPSTNTTPN